MKHRCAHSTERRCGAPATGAQRSIGVAPAARRACAPVVSTTAVPATAGISQASPPARPSATSAPSGPRLSATRAAPARRPGGVNVYHISDREQSMPHKSTRTCQAHTTPCVLLLLSFSSSNTVRTTWARQAGSSGRQAAKRGQLPPGTVSRRGPPAHSGGRPPCACTMGTRVRAVSEHGSDPGTGRACGEQALCEVRRGRSRGGRAEHGARLQLVGRQHVAQRGQRGQRLGRRRR